MAIDHSKLRYSPTLRLKVAEMRALEQLFDDAKQQLLPTILVRPWANSPSVEKGFDRIELALGGGPYCVDLDPKLDTARGHPQALRDLREFALDANAWYSFVRDHENCIPYLRSNAELPDLSSTRFQWMRERGFAIPIRHPFSNIREVLDFVSRLEDSNFFVNVDAGWDTDILSREANVVSVVRSLIEVNDTVKIVVTSSSFPWSFDGFGIGTSHGLAEIELFERVRQHASEISNEADVFYGDWATTRPPLDRGGGQNDWCRIDVPLDRSVTMFRRKREADETKANSYEILAESAVASEFWSSVPNSWGKYLVELTASGSPSGIRAPNMNVAPRINMHIQTQINRLGGSSVSGGTEEYED